MTQQPTVSLCLIVRDEEHLLPRAVASALHLVDEVVVCDTGSRDGTVQAAQDLGARVVHFGWRDDFAAARNACLDAATGRWILVLDADEELQPVDPGRWAGLLIDPQVAGYEVTIRGTLAGREPDFQALRLFRNDPAVRYCFPIHEQITPALNAWAAARGLQVAPSPLMLLHSGYEPARRAAKRPRNRRILLMAVQQFPDEPYLHFQLGGESVSLLDDEVVPRGGMNEAAVSLEKAWELAGELSKPELLQRPWLARLAALLGSARLTAGYPAAALEVLRRGLDLFPRDLVLHHLFCLAALEEGAIEPGEIEDHALLLGERKKHGVLGDLHRRQGDCGRGARHFQQALAGDPEYSRALLGMARCFRDEQRPREALGFFLKAVAAGNWNWRAWLEGARLMAELELTDQTRSWRATFAEHFPDHPEAN